MYYKAECPNPNCGERFNMPFIGEAVHCPKCGAAIYVPKVFDMKDSMKAAQHQGVVATVNPFAWLMFLVAFLIWSHWLRPILGWEQSKSIWIIVIWWCATFFASMLCSIGPVDLAFIRITGNSYQQDRSGYVRASGRDIAGGISLGVFGIYFIVYWITFLSGPPDPIHAFRNPWLFLAIMSITCLALSHMIARIAFKRYMRGVAKE